MVRKTAIRRSVPPGDLPDFTPVPRKNPRHDGWTVARQRAFIEALADTGCVAIAARMVNMSKESAYQLRRQPGATSFRRAWDAAQTLGLQPVKDEAFDRAMNGQLVPVFVGGKLMGFRRKKNDGLLMFILRHYGQDAQGRKTTVNYFSTRASAGAGASGEGGTGAGVQAAAQASTTTVKTVISGGAAAPTPLAADDTAANVLNAFEGVALDAEAQAEIRRTLEACAERRRALRTDWDTPRAEALARQAADPECDFIRVAPGSVEYLGELESGVDTDEFVPFNEDESHWESIGEPVPEWFTEWQEREEARQAAKALPSPELPSPQAGEGLRERGPGEAVQQFSSPPAEGAPDSDPGPVPSPPAPQRAYKKRTPKPPFTPPTACPGPRSGEAHKAQAAAEVKAVRRAGAADEGERRRKKKKPS